MRKWGKKQRKREGMKYSHKLIKKKKARLLYKERGREQSLVKIRTKGFRKIQSQREIEFVWQQGRNI